jgi:hypothetical protein
MVVKWKGTMERGSFDILKRHEDGSFKWLEVAPDLPTAKARLQELYDESPGAYFVFDKSTQQIVAQSNSHKN